MRGLAERVVGREGAETTAVVCIEEEIFVCRTIKRAVAAVRNRILVCDGRGENPFPVERQMMDKTCFMIQGGVFVWAHIDCDMLITHGDVGPESGNLEFSLASYLSRKISFGFRRILANLTHFTNWTLCALNSRTQGNKK